MGIAIALKPQQLFLVYLQVHSQSVIGCAQEVGISKKEMLFKKTKGLLLQACQM
jgi:hypothetical protein